MKQIISWLIALTLCVLAAEIALQLVAVIVAADGRGDLPGSKQGYRIVTLGDSNTYGLYLDESESWPAQFQTRWNKFAKEHSDVSPVEVLNLGVPGTNSSRLLKNYADILDTFKPDMALVMIGFNDWWTPNEPMNPQKISLVDLLKEKSRLYRFYHLIKADQISSEDIQVMQRSESLGALTTEQIIAKVKEAQQQPQQESGVSNLSTRVKIKDKEFLLGFDGAKGEPGGFKQLKANLQQIAKISSNKGVTLVLVNYAGNQKFYAMANDKLQAYTAELQLPLINVQAKMQKVCVKALECPDLFFPDMHPRPKGYAVVAESVFDYFSSLNDAAK